MSQSSSAVQVLYGTATGTAEDVAQNVAELLTLTQINVKRCCAIDHYPIAALPRDAALGDSFLFVVSTCGDGHVPVTMRNFWHFLRRADLPSGVLSALRFAVFGLGDRFYVKFNAAARKLFLRLTDLGATPIVPLALGDESAQGGFDAQLFPWIEQVCDTMGLKLVSQVKQEPRIRVELHEDGDSEYDEQYVHDMWHSGQAVRSSVITGGELFEARVCGNEVVTKPEFLDDNKQVRHVSLDVSGACEGSLLGEYVAGDVVHVMPRNRESAVDAFFKLTQFNENAMIHVQSLNSAARFGSYQFNIKCPCTFREFVSAQLDLSCIPRRRFFERLAPFATDALQKEKLVEFASAQGADLLTQYAYREKRTILMVLRDFPSARPPLSYLIDMIPVLKPRAFSIASSVLAHPNQIHICASMVQYTTPLRFSRVGVCSSFLMRLEQNDIVPIYLEQGSSLRFNEYKPCILVAPGTGVAPMRSFLSSCIATGQKRIMFFGSRCREGDFLYEAEWDKLQATGILSQLVTAFSRQFEYKVYVQDKMRKSGELIWDLLSNQEANVYIAGAAGAMPKAVRQTLVDICASIGALGEKNAEEFVRKLETTGRLQMECW